VTRDSHPAFGHWGQGMDVVSTIGWIVLVIAVVGILLAAGRRE
jgi:hypothetical protein